MAGFHEPEGQQREEVSCPDGVSYLRRAGGEAENSQDADANNSKKHSKGEDDPECPGWGWEAPCNPPGLGARQEERTTVEINPAAGYSSP